MKQKLLKTMRVLLVAALLGVGTSAWAATYTTTYNKAVTADAEAGVVAWDSESDISATEWVVSNSESNMGVSIDANAGMILSIISNKTGSNYATKTFSAVPSDGIVQYEVTWKTYRMYDAKGYAYIQFGDQFRLTTGYNYYGDQPLYVNYNGASSTSSKVINSFKSDTNHNILVKIDSKNKKILLFSVDGTDYTTSITTTLSGSVFNTFTYGANKSTANGWENTQWYGAMSKLKVSYLANAIYTWDFLNTDVWGNYTSGGPSDNFVVSATGSEVWFAPDGSAATSATSNVSFKYEADKARFNYGGTKGLGFSKSYKSENDINYTKVIIPKNYKVIVDFNTGSTGRPIVFNLADTEVGSYKYSGTYTYTNEDNDPVTLKVYGNNVKDDYSTNTIKKIILVDTDNTDSYSYIVNAIDADGNILKNLASGTAKPYETYSATGIPYVISKDGVFYELTDSKASSLSETFTMGEEYALNTVSYTKNSDIVFFQEYESMSANGGRINSWGSSTASNGNGAYIGYTSVTKITNATTNSISETGVYDVIVRACDRSGKTQTKTLYLTDGSTDKEIGTLSSSGKSSSWSSTTLSNISIASGQYFKLLTGSESSNDTFVGDFILVKKSKVNATIASSGYSSLASSCALDFAKATKKTENAVELTAFAVTKITKDAVTLSSISQAPATTGVILKGTAGATYSIPVIPSAEAPTTNLLKAAVTATTLEDGTFYILKGGDFCLVKNTADEAARTIPAGKAYLLASDVPNEARSLSFVFDSEATTGVSEATLLENNEESIKNGEFYNLQGQRVECPTKGLYIVNGTKVIIK